jgi:hypothetical protein
MRTVASGRWSRATAGFRSTALAPSSSADNCTQWTPTESAGTRTRNAPLRSVTADAPLKGLVRGSGGKAQAPSNEIAAMVNPTADAPEGSVALPTTSTEGSLSGSLMLRHAAGAPTIRSHSRRTSEYALVVLSRHAAPKKRFVNMARDDCTSRADRRGKKTGAALSRKPHPITSALALVDHRPASTGSVQPHSLNPQT